MNYLLYNSAEVSITQASYTSPKLKVSGESICLTFNYTMYGAEMGSVCKYIIAYFGFS